MSRKSKRRPTARGQNQASSSKVLRAVTFVLTPFLITAILFSFTAIGLNKPYNKIKPYTDLAFGASAPDAANVSTLNKAVDDDPEPTVVKEIEVDVEGTGEKTKAQMVYPYYGDFYATLNCESAGMKDIKVYSGTSNEVLYWGAGWYNGSVYIGNPGNVVIAGHNHTDFYYLPNMNIGDEVTLETSYVKITYICEESVVFHETDYTYVMPTEDDRLTLYTCWNNGYLGMSEWRLAKICKPVEWEWKEVEAD